MANFGSSSFTLFTKPLSGFFTECHAVLVTFHRRTKIIKMLSCDIYTSVPNAFGVLIFICRCSVEQVYRREEVKMVQNAMNSILEKNGRIARAELM